MTSRALRSLVLLLLFSTELAALDKSDPFLDLPGSLPPSVFSYIHSQPVFNATTGQVRFVPLVQKISRNAFLNRLRQDQAFEFIHFSATVNPRSGGPPEVICDCTLLEDNEFVVSEQPVRLENGHYVSINDETYKAILELIDYPLANPALNATAFSELAYVYNADVLATFLADRQFDLVSHHGFMNSADYPGYRDTQYLVTRGQGALYIIIRGTSGASDIETSLDTELTPFRQLGFAHEGYLDVAGHIYAEVKPLVQTTDLPVIITGHSLGGSVALLLGLMFTDDGLPVSNLNFAPVPVVDQKVARHFEDVARINNYFLENEELAELEAAHDWLRLPGERNRLPDVGTTAGAAHFVINYLKSMLVTQGYSRNDYEASMPDCVVIKYPCFDGNRDNFISACAFNVDTCFERQIEKLLGFQVTQPINTFPGPAQSSVETLINRTTNALLMTPRSEIHKQAQLLRLAYLSLLAREPKRAANLMGTRSLDTGGFSGFLNRAISEQLAQTPPPSSAGIEAD